MKFEDFPEFDKVLIFKSGYAVLQRTITLDHREVNQIIDSIPYAVHGTIWFDAGPNVKITSLNTIQTVLKNEKKKCGSYFELLQSNINQQVEIFLQNKTVVNGKIESVAKSIRGELVYIEELKGSEVCIKVKDIELIKGVKLSKVKEEEVRKLQINYIPIKKDEPVIIRYLISKLGWAPTYRLLCNGETNTASLSLQACIINDAEDFNAKELICCSGSPNIKFSSLCDPLVSTQAVTSFFISLANLFSDSPIIQRKPAGRWERRSCVMEEALSCSSCSVVSEENIGPAPDDQPTNIKDTKEFYEYCNQNIFVQKNGRTIVPIFTIPDVKYDDVYKCVVNESSPELVAVRHAIRLRNRSQLPWTTAPIFLSSKDQMFTGQSHLVFTAKNTYSEVDLNKVYTVLVKFSQNVVKTKNTKKIQGIKYEKVETTTVLKLTNLLPKDITMLVKVSFTGDLKKTNHKKHKIKQKLNYTAINSHTDINYDIPLKTKESYKLTYLSTKFVRL